MRICVNEILKKYIFSSGFDEEQDAKDACKPLCDAIDYEVTEVRVGFSGVSIKILDFLSTQIMMKYSQKCTDRR